MPDTNLTVGKVPQHVINFPTMWDNQKALLDKMIYQDLENCGNHLIMG